MAARCPRCRRPQACWVGSLPGVSSLPGSNYASAGSYVPYYNKERKTQLLLLMRARVVADRE